MRTLARAHGVPWRRAQGRGWKTWPGLILGLPGGAWDKSLASLSLILLIYKMEQKSH